MVPGAALPPPEGRRAGDRRDVRTMPGRGAAMSFVLNALKQKQGLRRYIGPKRVLILVALTGAVVFAWNGYRNGVIGPQLIVDYRAEYPVATVLLFVAVYAISVMAALPSLPMNLAAGFLWGGLVGGLYSAIGVTIGGWVSFFAARWLIGQPLAERIGGKWVAQVQREFERDGWKFVAFARMNPIIPTGPLNYLLGLTALSHRAFLAATFVFLLPPSIAVAYIGDSLRTFTADRADVREIIVSILAVSTAVTVLAAIKYASVLYKRRADPE